VKAINEFGLQTWLILSLLVFIFLWKYFVEI